MTEPYTRDQEDNVFDKVINVVQNPELHYEDMVVANKLEELETRIEKLEPRTSMQEWITYVVSSIPAISYFCLPTK